MNIDLIVMILFRFLYQEICFLFTNNIETHNYQSSKFLKQLSINFKGDLLSEIK